MAAIVLWEPRELYNLLNQRVIVSRLAEINYLCLIDARERQDYNVSHIITAKNAKTDSLGTFLPFENLEVDSMEHIVVYDSNTNSLDESGRAMKCAKMLAKTSLCIVHILKEGFEKFSALYPFLRTEQILYTPKDLENIRAYPVEIVADKVYMGDNEQSSSRSLLENLKIKAVLCISEFPCDYQRCAEGLTQGADDLVRYIWNIAFLTIKIAVWMEFSTRFQKICDFIDSYMEKGSRVLIVSEHGTVRCSIAATAYVMHHYQYSVQEAWKYVQRCKPNIRLNTSSSKQLSNWEHQIVTKWTDNPVQK